MENTYKSMSLLSLANCFKKKHTHKHIHTPAHLNIGLRPWPSLGTFSHSSRHSATQGSLEGGSRQPLPLPSSFVHLGGSGQLGCEADLWEPHLCLHTGPARWPEDQCGRGCDVLGWRPWVGSLHHFVGRPPLPRPLGPAIHGNPQNREWLRH